MNLEEKLQRLPDKPGVYLMRDAAGTVIYVGKAASLKNRVRSYFRSLKNQPPKVHSLVKNIEDFEYIVTDTEVEALILEYNLIKKYDPKYNVVFRDDKSYPYLKITLNEEFPRVEVTRNMRKDGSKYFGPYTSVGALNETVRLLRRLFPLRTCRQASFEQRKRACLNAHIKRCTAPCVGNISREEYGKMVREVVLFMEGKQDALLRRLQERMEKYAKDLDFENAAQIRDQIKAVEAVLEKQKIVSPGGEDQDVIAMARGSNEVCIQVFYVRKGKLIGREHFFLERTDDLSRGEVMTAFLKQYYNRAAEIPPVVLLGDAAEDQALIEEWLTQVKGRKVVLHVPRRGEKLKLVEMVAANALVELQEHEEDRRKKAMSAEQALLELQEYLDLEVLPRRIECYDISNISGTDSVGSMVVFENGSPKHSDYRRFKIGTVTGPDDFASLQEVLRRRFKRKKESQGEGGRDNSFGKTPDLLIIDGGKGQLGAVREVLMELGTGDIPTFGLAKKEEELFVEGRQEPIILPRGSQALFLLQRIRDEAHRFAVSYHRRLRDKKVQSSILDEVPGIGPKRKRSLLRKFGSVKAIRRAAVEELAEVEGMTLSAAQKLHEYLGGSGEEKKDI
jgi:excinuclease ABC subunit C